MHFCEILHRFSSFFFALECCEFQGKTQVRQVSEVVEQDDEDPPDIEFKENVELASIAIQTDEMKPPTPEAEEEPPEMEVRETQVWILKKEFSRVVWYFF